MPSVFHSTRAGGRTERRRWRSLRHYSKQHVLAPGHGAPLAGEAAACAPARPKGRCRAEGRLK